MSELDGSDRLPARLAVRLALWAACAAPVMAQEPAQEPAPAPEQPKPPKYSFLRQDEDWSEYVGGTFDYYDPIKHIELSDDGETWIGFGGRLEARVEDWDDFNFGSTTPGQSDDDTFTLSRALLYADLHVGQRFRVFGEIKTAQSTDRDLMGGRRPLDMDTLALQQLFADVHLEAGSSSNVRVRAGRQALLLGRQRLVSPLPWGNTLRTWDGLTVDHYAGDWRTTALFTAFVPVDKTDFNERDDDQLLYGLYARHVPKGADHGLELYWLGSTRDTLTVNGTTGDSKRHTFGARAWSGLGAGVDAEVEGAWQLGEVGTSDVRAGFVTAELGWRPDQGLWSHRWFLGLDWASGDDAAGGSVGTFDQLYPLGHAYLGYADFVGRQNVVAANVGVSVAPVEDLTLRLAVHSFWLEDEDDALYAPSGRPLIPAGAFSSSEIGQEIDLSGRYVFGRHLSAYGGYSWFDPGSAVEDAGTTLNEDVDFLYLGFSYTF